MKRLVPTLVLALAASALPMTASAQTPPPPTNVPAQDAKQGPRQLRPRVPPPVRPSGFDARGWTLLGEQTVDGRRDRDVIRVGRSARYADLTLVVEDSDLELLDLTIHFDNGTTFVPSVRQFFRDGSRTRAIAMPKDGRAVTRIELRYGNVVAGGRARVQAWGKEETQAPAPTRPSGFDARGWTLLGEKHVDGRRDRDSFRINRQDAAVTKLAFVVEDASAYLTGVTVYFGNGQKYSPMLTQVVGDAARVRVIDLPGEIRRVNRVEFSYGQEGSGRPRVQVWGKQEEALPAKPSNFDPRGWTFLAEKTVDGWQDKDTINVKPQYGNFTKLALVVEDSDLELLDVNVSYGRGQRYSLDVRQVFRDGSRAKIIDLPGTAAAVKRIELKYRNLPGDARPARVQVWAREDVAQTPAPSPGQPDFDPRGLTALGGVNVDPNARTQHMEGFVGRNRFSKITVYAVKGDLDLEGIVLTYPSFKKTNVPVKHRFADGARVLTFDVPPSNELIQSLTFRYGRNRGPGVSLQIFGTLASGTLPAPGPAPSPSVPVQVQGSLDTRGWTAVGAVNADPSRGVDTFVGGIARTRLNKVALLVDKGELALDGFTLVFGDNSTMAPNFRHTFKDGARVIVIEVPANKGAIKQLELRYADRNAARVGIQVFGLK